MLAQLLILALFTALVAAAQQQGNAASHFIRDFASGQKGIFTAPLRMNQRQFLTTALPLVGGTIALRSLDRRITSSLPNTPDQLDWSHRVSLAGSALGLTMAVGATSSTGALTSKPGIEEMGRDAGLALAHGMVTTYALKALFWRERPDRPGARGSLYSGGDALPSGHAMTSFAVASAVSLHPRCPRWLAITLYTTATAISLSRISANRHWAADVYSGAFTGILIGRSVARASRLR